MKTKAYTDLEQSKKLVEILPIESADMCYEFDWDLDMNTKYKSTPIIIEKCNHFDLHSQDIPCWSLAALLTIIPCPSLNKTFMGWRCDSYNEDGTKYKLGKDADEPFDACYNMILQLNEQKLI